MILRRMLAIWISKATCVVCKLAGKQGVTLAGKIALKIDPKILMELSGRCGKRFLSPAEQTERRQPIICSARQSRQKVRK